MNVKINKHTTTTEYYSVTFPKDVSMAAVGRYLGVERMTVYYWQKRIPKKRLAELMAIPESAVKK